MGLERCGDILDFDWTPAYHVQCEDRLHGVGQKSTVFSYYLKSQYDIDTVMCEHIREKLEIAAEVYGEEDMMSHVIKKILGVKATA